MTLAAATQLVCSLRTGHNTMAGRCGMWGVACPPRAALTDPSRRHRTPWPVGLPRLPPPSHPHQVLELIYAKRVARKRKLHAFLRAGGAAADSGGDPAVYWAPARHTPETEALLAAQQQELAQWEVRCAAGVEVRGWGCECDLSCSTLPCIRRRSYPQHTTSQAGCAQPLAGWGTWGCSPARRPEHSLTRARTHTGQLHLVAAIPWQPYHTYLL